MAVLDIRMDGDPILNRRTMRLKSVNSQVRGMLKDMTDTLHATNNGAAIAGPQVGLPFRLVVIDMGEGLIQLVNPVIVYSSGVQESEEGCLSFPGMFGITVRPKRVRVEALDENGKAITLRATGEMAKCLCHEIDHLDGTVFVSHVKRWI